MQTVLLTLVSSTNRIDLKLPAEVPIGELLPRLVELCSSLYEREDAQSQWRLVIPTKNVALPPTQSLLACGVVDGAILLLQDNTSFVAQPYQAQALQFRPQALPPSSDTGGIGVRWNLPDR